MASCRSRALTLPERPRLMPAAFIARAVATMPARRLRSAAALMRASSPGRAVRSSRVGPPRSSHGSPAGNIAASHSSDARVTPRSVTSPVTSRAGVTSNAGLAARAPCGAIATFCVCPYSSRPAICSTSSASRYSMGMDSPDAVAQSIVGDGTAT